MAEKRKKRKHSGFTLIELVIVVAILAVLAAVLTPMILGYVKKSQETVCNYNRNAVAKEIYMQEVVLADPLTDQQIKELIDSHKGKICPAGGKISIYRQTSRIYIIVCDKHKGDVQYSPEVIIQSNYDKLNPDDYSSTSKNDRLFKDYYDKYGWEVITYESVTYYVKPYFDAKTNRMTIYANTLSDATHNWNANLLFYNGKWYKYVAENSSFNSNKNFSLVGKSTNDFDLMISNKDVSAAQKLIETDLKIH